MQITNAQASQVENPITTKKEILIVTLGLILAAVGPFASDSYLPSLPAMTQFFVTTDTLMQLTVTLYLLGFSISQLFYGPGSDRFGRRKTILLGLTIAILGSLLCMMAPTPSLLIMGRFIQGMGMGVSNSVFRAIMRDTFSGTRMAKIGSYAGMVFSFAPALAPIIGGYIQASLGWQANFIFLSSLIISVMVLMWRFLPETNLHLNPDALRLSIVLRNYALLLSNKSFVGNTLCASFAFSGIIAYYVASPFLMQNVLHLSAVAYGWLAMTVAGGLILGHLANSLLVVRMGMKFMILSGILIMFFSGILMYAIGWYGWLNVPVIMIPTLTFIAGGGFVYANAAAGAFHDFAKMAGSAGAMYGCLQILGTVLTSLLVAGLEAHNQLGLALIYILLGLLSLATFFGLIARE